MGHAFVVLYLTENPETESVGSHYHGKRDQALFHGGSILEGRVPVGLAVRSNTAHP